MKLEVESKVKKEKLNRNTNTKAAIEVMRESFEYQDDAEVGIFWYDINNDELFGTYGVAASTIKWNYSPRLNKIIKTCSKLHSTIWKKEHFRGKDARFNGDHTKVPRGRIFEFKDIGFVVYTGDWIDDYPKVKNLILVEFNLPEDTKFVKDCHWDLGHGWSDEF